MEDPVLLPRQQLAIAARRLPDPSAARVKRIVVEAPQIEPRTLARNSRPAQTLGAHSIEFELDRRSLDGNSPIPVWRFEGKLFVDHWIEPDNPEQLRLFLELASSARAVEIHERQGEVARVSAYFRPSAPP